MCFKSGSNNFGCLCFYLCSVRDVELSKGFLLSG